MFYMILVYLLHYCQFNVFSYDDSVFFEFHPSFFVVKDLVKVHLKGPSLGGFYSLPIPLCLTAFLFAQVSSAILHNHLGHPHSTLSWFESGLIISYG